MSIKLISETDLKNVQDYIRIKNKKITIGTVVVSGKENDIYVSISPSFMVSGYGNSKKEAIESFEANLEVFCQDILNTSYGRRMEFLKKLGFLKVPYHNKNYSKTYVDLDGILHGLEEPTIAILETASVC